MQKNQRLENVAAATTTAKWVFSCVIGGAVFGTVLVYPLLALSEILPVSAASWGICIPLGIALTMLITRWAARVRQRQLAPVTQHQDNPWA